MRRAWIDAEETVSVLQQCVLAGVCRSTIYAQQKPPVIDERDLLHSRLIDEEYTRHPFYGSRRMVVFLKTVGHTVNRKRVQRLMRQMGLAGMAPGPNTSRSHPEHQVYPYLLRGVAVVRPNQVWSAEIVCTQMTKTDMLAARMSGNHVANLDFGIGNNHAVNQQFDQAAFLLEAGVGQATPDTSTEIIDSDCKLGHFCVPFGLGRQLRFLFRQGMVSLFQFASPSFIFG